jgi:SRSO17 transposase
MVAEQIGAAPDTIARWSESLDALSQRIARRFARVEVRERVRRYLVGLLGTVERKNGWQLAEAIGAFGAKGAPRLLHAAAWDADAVRDDWRGSVVAHRGDNTSGILIVDETGFRKKGTKSCGVARHYTGTAGDTVDCHATQRVPGGVARLRLGARCGMHRPRPVSSPRRGKRPGSAHRGGHPG